MGKKIIEVMDTSYRDGLQSVFGARVLRKDFMPTIQSALDAGILHFEAGGGARFQSLFFYLNENAFEMMDDFRAAVGEKVILQTLARGVNYVGLDTGSRDVVRLHAKLFKKHGITTVRNFDALNDVDNLDFSGRCIEESGLKHEIVITLMDLPPGCSGAHDVAFYEKVLRQILDSGIPFTSVCFKDASGTSSPRKMFDTISVARRLLSSVIPIRVHTHETAGVSIACYLAAIEAGAEGIDLAREPLSGGTGQPDFLTMHHAIKGTNFVLGNHEGQAIDMEKVLESEHILRKALKDYEIPPEALAVSALIPFSPMPGGALTANTQMMRDNGMLEKLPTVILAMREVVERGGYATSVTPVSQFYFQQAFNNVIFGPWERIADGYGRMVLGYFGKTPVEPDPKIVELAREQLELEPTRKNSLDLADQDETKSLAHAKKELIKNSLPTHEENLFIVAACKEKGIVFLKGEAEVQVRKKSDQKPVAVSSPAASPASSAPELYTVMVDGRKYNVEVSEGSTEDITVSPQPVPATVSAIVPTGVSDGEAIRSGIAGTVMKVPVSVGESVASGQVLVILESMKMEIEIKSHVAGRLLEVMVRSGQKVEDGHVLATVAI